MADAILLAGDYSEAAHDAGGPLHRRAGAAVRDALPGGR